MRAYGTQGPVHSNVGLLASSGAKPPWKLYRKAPADNRVRYSTTDTGSDQRTEVVQHQALAVLKDRKSTRLNSSHQIISYAVFCLKKKKSNDQFYRRLNS